MRTARVWIRRLVGVFVRTRRDREFEAELASHLQLHVDDNRRAGMTAAEARRQALIGLGGLEQARLRYRAQTGLPLLESLGRDLRFSVRLLRRSPGFAAAVVLPVALGIAAATAVFSLVNGVLLRPLPFARPDRLVLASEHQAARVEDRWVGGGLPRGTIEAWQSEGRTIEGVAGYNFPLRTLSGIGEPRRVKVGAVSTNLFELLGAAPALGRFFARGEDRPPEAAVAVLSYALWTEQFGRDRAAVGRTLLLDERPYTIVGVARPDFQFPDRSTELWIPTVGGNTVARLREGATFAQAEAEATTIANRVRRAEAAAKAADGDGGSAAVGSYRVQLIGLLDVSTRSVRQPLVVMMGAAIAVLLVACASAANLLLVRTVRRGRELAVRAAIGASSRRIARELVIDSAVIGAVAGCVGLLLALGGHRAMLALLPSDFPRAADVAMDWRVVGFGVGVSMLAMLAASLAPLSLVRRADLVRTIQQSSQGGGIGTSRRGRRWFDSILVLGEVALCCTLLVAAGLLTRSFLALLGVDTGYEASHALSAQVSFPGSVSQPVRRTLTGELIERLEATRPVVAAGIINALPLETVVAVYVVENEGQRPVSVHYRVISPGYFEAAGMELVSGRGFPPVDSETAPPTVLVNDAFARKYREADGTWDLKLNPDSQGRRPEVIGVVRDVRDFGPGRPAVPTVYRSYLQVQPTFFNRVDLVVRTPDDPMAFVPALRRIVGDLDPRLALYKVETLEDQLREALATPRLYSVVLVVFAAVVVAIIGSGLFGMLAYLVVQRRREIAVRMALGADAWNVLSLVIGRTAASVAVGIAVGLASATALGRFLSGLLFGVTPLDAVSFITAPLVVAAIALLASLAPLKRALGVAASTALRAE